jgi:hypothetical protein
MVGHWVKEQKKGTGPVVKWAVVGMLVKQLVQVVEKELLDFLGAIKVKEVGL